MQRSVRQSLLGTAALAVMVSGFAGIAAAEMKYKRSSFAGATARDVSDIISGYVVEGTIGSASATFKVPTLTCGDDDRAIFMGIEGESLQSAADVILICSEGEPTYILEAFAGEDNPVAEVQPGDTVKVSLTASGGTITAKANNLTATAELDPETIVLYGTLDATEETLPPPDFGKAKFSKVKLNGKTLKKGQATKFDLEVDETTIKTGKLKKGKFSLTFKD